MRIENADKGGHGFIKLDPTVPEAGTGFGMNVTGSPNWNSLICGYDGADEADCQTAEQAKDLYKGGAIVDFELSWPVINNPDTEHKIPPRPDAAGDFFIGV